MLKRKPSERTPINKEICILERLPANIVNAAIKRVPSKETLTNGVISNEEKDKTTMAFVNINYPREKGEHLLKKCFKKLRPSADEKINFVCRYSVMKISFFTNMKDRLNKLSKSNVVYQFPCPGCESSYIGKTERTLFERTKEHVTCADSVIKGHLDKLNVEHLFHIHNLMLNDVNAHDFRLNFVCHNTR